MVLKIYIYLYFLTLLLCLLFLLPSFQILGRLLCLFVSVLYKFNWYMCQEGSWVTIYLAHVNILKPARYMRCLLCIPIRNLQNFLLFDGFSLSLGRKLCSAPCFFLCNWNTPWGCIAFKQSTSYHFKQDTFVYSCSFPTHAKKEKNSGRGNDREITCFMYIANCRDP